MTLKQLQRYLETEKWRETAKRGTDVCGSYPRCAYCNRYDEYPCAEAYNRYLAAPVKEEGDWLLPEPPVRRVFGGADESNVSAVRQEAVPAPRREEAPAPVKKPSEGIPVQRFVRRADVRTEQVTVPVQPASIVLPKQAAEPAPAAVAAAQPAPPKGGVLVRGRGTGTRVLVLTKKGNYGEAE